MIDKPEVQKAAPAPIRNDTISIRIPGDLLALIDRRAEAESRTRSNMIVVALREYFQK